MYALRKSDCRNQIIMTTNTHEHRFICDRMAGSLCRHLRLMGYDTLSANNLPPGNRREDTLLLQKAHEEDRILLTRDAELSRRDNSQVLYLTSEKIGEQLRQLIRAGLIAPIIRLTRCSICNNPLVPIPQDDLSELRRKIPDFDPGAALVLWCTGCRKAYWEGSHTSNMRTRIDRLAREMEGTR